MPRSEVDEIQEIKVELKIVDILNLNIRISEMKLIIVKIYTFVY